MAVSVICVGRLREKYFADAAEEYMKRLKRIMPVSVIELPDEPEPAQPSDKLNEAVMKREGEKILQKIGQYDHVIAMCIEGKLLSSEDLSKKLEQLAVSGKTQLTFLIGGSFGLHQSIKDMADLKLSMSPMTFPHHMARVMLLEQIYRAYQISDGTRYHK